MLYHALLNRLARYRFFLSMRKIIFGLFIGIFCSASIASEAVIVTTIKPLELIAREIAGEQFEVRSIVDPRQSSHHYTLKPSDRTLLARADLVLWIDPGFEVYLADFFANQGASQDILMASAIDGLRLYMLEDGTTDYHLWLDLNNAGMIAAALAEQLQLTAPHLSAQISANLAGFKARLDTLEGELAAQLSSSGQQNYAVYHDAYRYFEAKFNLAHSTALVRSTEIQPGMREIMQTREQLQLRPPACVMLDPEYNAALLETLLRDTEADQVMIDLMGVEAENYIELMHNLTNAFASC